MSGLVYLIVISIWLALTGLMLAFLTRRVWRGIREKKKMAYDVITICSAIVTLAWLGATFWYGGGRKYYYDAELARLCAVDGGVRVYETIVLPPEKFEKPRGNLKEPRRINFFKPIQEENALGPEYIYKTKRSYIKGALLRYRTEQKIFRKSDGKLLGETVFYSRLGGDLPLFSSPFTCPSELRSMISGGIFILNDSKEQTP